MARRKRFDEPSSSDIEAFLQETPGGRTGTPIPEEPPPAPPVTAETIQTFLDQPDTSTTPTAERIQAFLESGLTEVGKAIWPIAKYLAPPPESRSVLAKALDVAYRPISAVGAGVGATIAGQPGKAVDEDVLRALTEEGQEGLAPVPRELYRQATGRQETPKIPLSFPMGIPFAGGKQVTIPAEYLVSIPAELLLPADYGIGKIATAIRSAKAAKLARIAKAVDEARATRLPVVVKQSDVSAITDLIQRAKANRAMPGGIATTKLLPEATSETVQAAKDAELVRTELESALSQMGKRPAPSEAGLSPKGMLWQQELDELQNLPGATRSAEQNLRIKHLTNVLAKDRALTAYAQRARRIQELERKGFQATAEEKIELRALQQGEPPPAPTEPIAIRPPSEQEQVVDVLRKPPFQRTTDDYAVLQRAGVPRDATMPSSIRSPEIVADPARPAPISKRVDMETPPSPIKAEKGVSATIPPKRVEFTPVEGMAVRLPHPDDTEPFQIIKVIEHGEDETTYAVQGMQSGALRYVTKEGMQPAERVSVPAATQRVLEEGTVSVVEDAPKVPNAPQGEYLLRPPDVLPKEQQFDLRQLGRARKKLNSPLSAYETLQTKLRELAKADPEFVKNPVLTMVEIPKRTESYEVFLPTRGGIATPMEETQTIPATKRLIWQGSNRSYTIEPGPMLPEELRDLPIGAKVRISPEWFAKTPRLSEVGTPSGIAMRLEGPPGKTTVGWGKSNTLFTKDRYDAATQRWRERGTTLTAGLDPTMLRDLVDIGGYHFEAGAREFAAWSQAMLRELGRDIRPYLQQVWDELQKVKTPKAEAPPATPLATALTDLTTPSERATQAFERLAQPSGEPLPKMVNNINLERLLLTPDEKEVIRVTGDLFQPEITAQKRGVRPHGVTVESAQALARDFGTSLRRIQKYQPGLVLNAERITQARALEAQVVAAVEGFHRKALASGSAEDLANFATAFDNGAIVLKNVGGVSSELGRALEALKIKVGPTSVPGKTLREAMKGATPETARAIAIELAQRDLTEPGEWARAMRELSTKPTMHDYVREVLYPFMLSGPQTHERNLTSTLINVTFSIPSATMATVWDALLHHGQRQRFFREIPAMMYGEAIGIPKGVKAALRVMATEEPTFGRGVYAGEIGARQKVIPGKVGRVLRTPGVAMSAVDEGLKLVSASIEMHALAMNRAIGEGLRGKALWDRTAEIVSHPLTELGTPGALAATKPERLLLEMAVREGAATPEQVSRLRDIENMTTSVQKAFHDTFNQKPGIINQQIIKLRKTIDDAALALKIPLPPGTLIQPFLAIAGNMPKIVMEYSPLHGIDIAVKARAGTLVGRELTAEVGKMTFGSLLGGTIVAYALQPSDAPYGRVTGFAPKDANMRRTMYAGGYRPTSIWVSAVRRYVEPPEPMRSMVGIIGEYINQYRNLEGSRSEKIMQGAFNIARVYGRNLINKEWLTGMTSLLDMLSDDKELTRWATNLLGIAIPQLVTQAVRASDPTLRQPTSITEGLKERLPILRKDVPVMRSVWGEPVTRGTPGIAGSVKRFTSPLRMGEPASTDPVDVELRRLKIGVGRPSKTMTIKKRAVELTPQEYETLHVEGGRLAKEQVRRLVTSSRYTHLSPEDQADDIRKALAEAFAIIRDRLQKRVQTRLTEGR